MISCIIAVMDREEALQKMLPSWTKVEKIKDFVIVDWSSKKPIIENRIVKEQISKYGNISVVRVENQKYFYRCLAWNLAFQNTDPQNKILFKLDAEYNNLNHSWMNSLNLDQTNSLKDHFYRGVKDDGSLWGVIMVNKRHFESVKGYNENLESIWGYEDVDLYNRITKTHNLEACYFRNGCMVHEDIYQEDRFTNLKLKGYWHTLNLPRFIPQDGAGLPTRNNTKSFNYWETAKYKILEDSSVYRRVELIEN
jgi:hypothetical protein